MLIKANHYSNIEPLSFARAMVYAHHDLFCSLFTVQYRRRFAKEIQSAHTSTAREHPHERVSETSIWYLQVEYRFIQKVTSKLYQTRGMEN